MAGTPGSWSSTRTRPESCTCPTGFDFLGFNVRRYGATLLIKPIHGGDPADPGTARSRDARTARLQRGGGPRRAHPHHSGLGGLLPGSGVVQDVQSLDNYVWKLTYKWATRGHANKPNTWVCRPLLRQVQQVQERPLGVRRRRQRRLPGQVLLDRHRPAHRRSTAGRLPTTPPWPSTGPLGGDASNPRWTATRCACSPGRTAAAHSAGTTCSPPSSHHSRPTSGNAGGCRSPGRR